jgi:hypothetical protein
MMKKKDTRHGLRSTEANGRDDVQGNPFRIFQQHVCQQNYGTKYLVNPVP